MRCVYHHDKRQRYGQYEQRGINSVMETDISRSGNYRGGMHTGKTAVTERQFYIHTGMKDSIRYKFNSYSNEPANKRD